MPDLTPNFGFRKPLPTEDYKIDDQNFNWNLVDQYMGLHFCTSTTRPSSPKLRQQIYETDTGQSYVWTGSAWFRTTPGTVKITRWRTAATLATNAGTTEVLAGMATGDVYFDANRLYRVKFAVEWDSSLANMSCIYRIRQNSVTGPLWAELAARPAPVANKKYVEYIEAIILAGSASGNRQFVLTQQRDTTGTATLRTYGSDRGPAATTELLGGEGSLLNDV